MRVPEFKHQSIKLIYAFTEVSNILYLLVCFKLIHFVFRIFPLVVSELSVSFIVYNVQSISILTVIIRCFPKNVKTQNTASQD
jgi:hypothetical protein